MKDHKISMTMDALKHSLVPKHSKLSDSEKKELLEKYFVQLKQLPRIHGSDPALSSLSVKEGDIIKIERASKTAGIFVYYRVVAAN